jgi:hypothetical protein
VAAAARLGGYLACRCHGDGNKKAVEERPEHALLDHPHAATRQAYDCCQTAQIIMRGGDVSRAAAPSRVRSSSARL